jgi:uncharacterized protein (DUF2141 family)
MKLFQSLLTEIPAPACLAGLLASSTVGIAVPAYAAPLQISVTGIRNDKGWIDVCIFDSDVSFPDCSGGHGVALLRQPASPGTERFNIDVAPGLHAVSVLHDENGNGRLDTNFFGIPTEGGGVSNNPKPRMGPPHFSDAAIQVPARGDQIVILMVYP